MSEGRENGREGKSAIGKVKEKEKVRRESTGNLEELWKRKREEMDRSGGEEKEKIFKRSNMTARSPKKDSEIGVKELGKRMGEMMEEFRAVREELREGFREQGRKMRKEIEDLRREFREREKRWKEEREETNKQKEKMEERIRKLEEKMEERKEGKREEEGNGRGEVGEKMRELERRLERKEKEERRRNIVIRGLEVKEGGRKENAEKLLEGIGAKVKAIEVKKIGGDAEKGREMVLLKLENEEQKWEVMEKKRSLVGRKERITEDLSWEERRMNWRLREIAKGEEREGRRAWIKAGRIRLENTWWR
ncbi:uncharacterized protein LOC143905674 [Temnothorax americanus]|uniref:uncharacterized protein LOC143905674 n=1 Tax=Temnothorax americanus TaxID=1964332 RepID=UPI00406955DA